MGHRLYLSLRRTLTARSLATLTGTMLALGALSQWCAAAELDDSSHADAPVATQRAASEAGAPVRSQTGTSRRQVDRNDEQYDPHIVPPRTGSQPRTPSAARNDSPDTAQRDGKSAAAIPVPP